MIPVEIEELAFEPQTLLKLYDLEQNHLPKLEEQA